MANATIHKEQAKHNFSLLKKLQESEEFQDWQLTIAFYTALHIIDSVLSERNPDWKRLYTESVDDQAGWHAVRLKCINTLYREIYKNYRFLYEKSMLVRYLEAINKKATDVVSQREAKEFADTHLGAILTKFSISW